MKTEVQRAVTVSGFADEIDKDIHRQLEVVRSLGMNWITVRGVDGRNIGDYSVQEVTEFLAPKLQLAQVCVSSLGSRIGKIDVEDHQGFEEQCLELARLCEIAGVLGCRFIRMFSFYIPEGRAPEDYLEIILKKLRRFLDIAAARDVVLLHENEKDIFGDTAERCARLFEEIPDRHFMAAFDFANFVQCGQEPSMCWELLKARVRSIHIKDAVAGTHETVVCGTGDGRIREILRQALLEDGYTGFLELEPHLVLFEGLQALELADADEVIKEAKAKDGAEGYAMQYAALTEILEKI